MIYFIADTHFNHENIIKYCKRLIQGKGAFRGFKDYCFEMDIIQDWYKFRYEEYTKIAINWCKENGLKYK